MSRIGGKNTKPEVLLRSALQRAGFRFRLHRKDLPGKPDIVLPKYQTVIFVNGCFWHRHDCRHAAMPKTRPDFWKAKFKRTIQRDKENYADLEILGWTVVIVWECEIKERFEETYEKTVSKLK